MSESDDLDHLIWLKNMIRRVKESNDPSELIEAINAHPTGLLADEQVREVIIKSLKGDHLTKDRGRPRKDIERDSRLFVDMFVMTKEGMSIPEAAEVLEGALEQVKEEMEQQGLEISEKFAIKADQIAKIYLAERKRRGVVLKPKKGINNGFMGMVAPNYMTILNNHLFTYIRSKYRWQRLIFLVLATQVSILVNFSLRLKRLNI